MTKKDILEENKQLNKILDEYYQKVIRLEDAWVRDETIQDDGSLRPSISNTVKRAAEAEAEVKRLTKKLQEVTDNINIVDDENLSKKTKQLPMIDYYQGVPIAIHNNGDVYFNLAGLKIAIDKLYSDEKYRGRRS